MSQYPEQAGKPLLKARLSDKQWAQVLAINEVLSEEYRIRREMLLKRLDVTIQSFKWSDKAKVSSNSFLLLLRVLSYYLSLLIKASVAICIVCVTNM